MSRGTASTAAVITRGGRKGDWQVNHFQVTSPGRGFLVGDILTANPVDATQVAAWEVSAIDFAGRITELTIRQAGHYTRKPYNKQTLRTSVPRNLPCKLTIDWINSP